MKRHSLLGSDIVAVTELQRHAGAQFDPRAVDALCRALDREPAALTLRGTS
jgi:HD-GYP domain-containing protein (c-di-GMP phosphodiesterase class II)